MLFKPYHIPMIRSGSKTVTRREWRDNYNRPNEGSVQIASDEMFTSDDEADCYIRILDVYDQPLGEMTDEDAQKEGDYESLEEFKEGYEKVYGEDAWDPEKEVTVVEFEYVGNSRPRENEQLATDGGQDAGLGSGVPRTDGGQSTHGTDRSGATMQSSFIGPIEKIRRVFERLEGEEFDLVRIDLSGGKDSFVAAEAVRRLGPEYGLELDMVAHYNTGTGIPSTTELVQEYCADHGLPYVEGMNKTPKEMVGPQALDYGYYGAGEGRVMADRKHATAYVLRKQRVEDGLYGGFEGDILQFSGAYHDESDSRGGKMDGAIKWGETGERKPRLTIASPIYALTEGEVEALAERWDVPKAPAYATLGASGDCTGCAYDQTGRFGNLWAEAPHLAFAHATLMVWIQTRRARGELNLPPERVFFGWGVLDAETVEALRAEDEFYDPDEEIGPTAPEYAATYDEGDEDSDGDETEPPVLDPEQKRFTCSDCDDRCEPAIPITVADGGTPAPSTTETDRSEGGGA